MQDRTRQFGRRELQKREAVSQLTAASVAQAPAPAPLTLQLPFQPGEQVLSVPSLPPPLCAQMLALLNLPRLLV